MGINFTAKNKLEQAIQNKVICPKLVFVSGSMN